MRAATEESFIDQSLRGYQRQDVKNLRHSVAAGHRAPLYVLPCGGGKTVVLREIIARAVARGKYVTLFAPFRQLVYQAAEKLAAHSIPHGIVMAGEPYRPAPVQVASTATVHARSVRRSNPPPPADLILIDEAHLAITQMAAEVFSLYPDAVLLGCTATPSRTDGRGLGQTFDDMVLGPSVKWLTDNGFLVPADYYAPAKPDLTGVKLSGGDYIEAQLGQRMNTKKLVGDVVEHYLRFANGRRAAVFATTVSHSRHLCQRFLEAGIAAEHIDGGTPNDLRHGILERVRSGETQVLCNCQVLRVGWDEPSLEVAIMARPTKSLTLWIQSIGRVLRPAPGKEKAMVIDHSGSVDELGFADEEHVWTLEGLQKKSKSASKSKPASEPAIITCEKCDFVYMRSDRCPRCEHVPVKKGRAVENTDGDLAKIDRSKKRLNANMTWEQKVDIYGQFLGLAREWDKRPGWAANLYRGKFGVWPNDPRLRAARAKPPTAEVRAYGRSRLIAFAKRMERERGTG